MEECPYCGNYAYLGIVPSFNLAMCVNCWIELKSLANEAIECIKSEEDKEYNCIHQFYLGR